MLLKDSPVGYTRTVGLLWGTAAGEGGVAPISLLLAIPVTMCGGHNPMAGRWYLLEEINHFSWSISHYSHYSHQSIHACSLFNWTAPLGSTVSEVLAPRHAWNLKSLPALMDHFGFVKTMMIKFVRFQSLAFLLPSYCHFGRCCKLAILYCHYSCYSSIHCCKSFLCFKIISFLNFVRLLL
jgi:hypothetical protein